MTNTDSCRGADWLIDDEVSRLRLRGTETAHPVVVGAVIGSGADCAIRLSDPEGHVSRQHARIIRDTEHLAIEDLKSKNGLSMAGTQRPKFPLTPGLEIGIGSLVLVAESPRSIELRGLLQCLMGWEDAEDSVDLALQSIHTSAAHRGVLVLCGKAELVAIAQMIHRHTFPSGPFIECNPRRIDTEERVHAPRNIRDGVAALKGAMSGTLCLHADRRPSNFTDILTKHRRVASRAQVILCSPKIGSEPGSINIRPFANRSHADQDRIVRTLGAAAVQGLRPELDSAPVALHADDLAWTRQQATTFGEIEKTAARLTALRAFAGTIAAAARALHMTAPALSEWVAGRKLPPY